MENRFYQERLEELRTRIKNGESELLDQLEWEVAHPPNGEGPDPVMERLRVKRSYTMTEAALEQRRKATAHSTGPRTEEGKANSSRNNWKTGLHSRSRILSLGKPCKSTCLHYPCNLVDDGATAPGKQCLDKEYMLSSINAISKALQDGDLTDLKDVVTLQLGSTLQVIDELQSSILEYGVYMKSEKLDKEGKVIGYEIKPNPSLLPLSKLLQSAGVTMPEFMVTPAAVEKKKTIDEGVETLADIFRGTAAQLALAKEKKGQ